MGEKEGRNRLFAMIFLESGKPRQPSDICSAHMYYDCGENSFENCRNFIHRRKTIWRHFRRFYSSEMTLGCLGGKELRCGRNVGPNFLPHPLPPISQIALLQFSKILFHSGQTKSASSLHAVIPAFSPFCMFFHRGNIKLFVFEQSCFFLLFLYLRSIPAAI